MKAKYLLLLLSALAIILFSSGCSSDKEETSSNSSKIDISLIIGTWMWEDDEETETWTFNADGWGIIEETYNYGGTIRKDQEHFLYSYENGLLKLTFNEGNSTEEDVLEVIKLTKDILVLGWSDYRGDEKDDGVVYLTRVK